MAACRAKIPGLRRLAVIVLFALAPGCMNALELGGRIDLDASARGAPAQANFEVRRAQLDVRARDGDASLQVMTEWSAGRVTFKKAFIETAAVGTARLRAGYMTEPFGLERVTSSRHLTFLDRAPTSDLAPGRNSGVMLHDYSAATGVHWAFGVFKESDGLGQSVGGPGANLTARATWLVWQGAGTDLFHAGASANLRRFETTTAHDGKFVSGEAALLLGPASLQAEATGAQIDLLGGATARQHAAYAQASVFVTGEQRHYVAGQARFGRVHPNGRGGAWEIALRVAHVDRTEGPVASGRLTETTAGVNWYANDRTRVMFDIKSSRERGKGTATIARLRWQLDF